VFIKVENCLVCVLVCLFASFKLCGSAFCSDLVAAFV